MIMAMLTTQPEQTILATHTVVDSPLGELTVVAKEEAIVGLYFTHHWYRPNPSMFGDRIEYGFDNVRQQLDEYFAGERQEFDLPLYASGGELQRNVWDLIRQVPYGQTATYGQLARDLGDGTTPQAVGVAVGRNPLCILIPCHRIVGANGKLTGYAGGLDCKQALLNLERETAEQPGRLF
jgi:methylated-DNA-[protein]-cysteine S-methyltransferase